MQRLRVLWLGLLALTLAVPLHAYTIYPKDGSRLIAREKYRVEQGRAIIILQNGTQTFIDASEIDTTRTEQANQGQYGTALMLEEGEFRDIEAPAPKRETTLTDLARRDSPARSRTPARREVPQAPTGRQLRTSAGYVDLASLGRKPYRNLEISTEIQRVFRAKGVGELQIYQGTRPENPFLEITTNSEASVFRSLEAAADALLHLRNQFANDVQNLELLLATASQERAGQFVVTPDLAAELAEKRIEASAFFVRFVQF
jgi:hypothetical protein